MRDIVKDPWIQVYSGRVIGLLNPTADDILLADIAHGLSNICRFHGSCTVFYSVAQHSVGVSSLVSRENALWGLLHDASEAYLGDVARPLKIFLNGKYRKLEELFMKVICEKFDIPEREPPEIKEADNNMLLTERRDLLLEQEEEWGIPGNPVPERIIPWSPRISKAEFLARYGLLSREGLA